jgi:hypothetical protein
VAAVLLAAPPVFAGEVVYAATLKATDDDPSATGQAVWSLETGTRGKRLTVAVQNVQSTDLAQAFVSGRFVGYLLIAGGSGGLDLDSFQGDKVPRAQASSLVLITIADQVPILYGTLMPDR